MEHERTLDCVEFMEHAAREYGESNHREQRDERFEHPRNCFICGRPRKSGLDVCADCDRDFPAKLSSNRK
jgi:hypothetical protein